MLRRSPITRTSLAATAALAMCGLLYIQFSEYFPEALQLSNADALRKQNPACALADVPRDHLLVAASIWEGGAHSGLILGNVQTATKVVQVNVAAGESPITAFLSGYGVIWNFTGDVGRVRRVVAMSQFMNQMAGVAGVPAERVEIPGRIDCPYFKDAMSLEKGAVRANALAVLFGRRPDRDAYQRKATHLSLPEAGFALSAETAANTTAGRALAPSDVVAAVPVSKPQILPGTAGLAQLEADGAIRKPTKEEVQEFLAGASRQYQSKLSPDFLLQTKFDYTVTRDVVLPTGLSFEPKLLFLAGVPPFSILGLSIPTGTTTGRGFIDPTGVSFTDFEKVIGSSLDDRMDLWWLNPGGALSSAQETALQNAARMPVQTANNPQVAQDASDARMAAAGQIDQNKVDVLIEGNAGADYIQGTRTGINTIKGGAGNDHLYESGDPLILREEWARTPDPAFVFFQTVFPDPATALPVKHHKIPCSFSQGISTGSGRLAGVIWPSEWGRGVELVQIPCIFPC